MTQELSDAFQIVRQPRPSPEWDKSLRQLYHKDGSGWLWQASGLETNILTGDFSLKGLNLHEATVLANSYVRARQETETIAVLRQAVSPESLYDEKLLVPLGYLVKPDAGRAILTLAPLDQKIQESGAIFKPWEIEPVYVPVRELEDMYRASEAEQPQPFRENKLTLYKLEPGTEVEHYQIIDKNQNVVFIGTRASEPETARYVPLTAEELLDYQVSHPLSDTRKDALYQVAKLRVDLKQRTAEIAVTQKSSLNVLVKEWLRRNYEAGFDWLGSQEFDLKKAVPHAVEWTFNRVKNIKGNFGTGPLGLKQLMINATMNFVGRIRDKKELAEWWRHWFQREIVDGSPELKLEAGKWIEQVRLGPVFEQIKKYYGYQHEAAHQTKFLTKFVTGLTLVSSSQVIEARNARNPDSPDIRAGYAVIKYQNIPYIISDLGDRTAVERQIHGILTGAGNPDELFTNQGLVNNSDAYAALATVSYHLYTVDPGNKFGKYSEKLDQLLADLPLKTQNPDEYTKLKAWIINNTRLLRNADFSVDINGSPYQLPAIGENAGFGGQDVEFILDITGFEKDGSLPRVYALHPHFTDDVMSAMQKRQVTLRNTAEYMVQHPDLGRPGEPDSMVFNNYSRLRSGESAIRLAASARHLSELSYWWNHKSAAELKELKSRFDRRTSVSVAANQLTAAAARFNNDLISRLDAAENERRIAFHQRSIKVAAEERIRSLIDAKVSSGELPENLGGIYFDAISSRIKQSGIPHPITEADVLMNVISVAQKIVGKAGTVQGIAVIKPEDLARMDKWVDPHVDVAKQTKIYENSQHIPNDDGVFVDGVNADDFEVLYEVSQRIDAVNFHDQLAGILKAQENPAVLDELIRNRRAGGLRGSRPFEQAVTNISASLQSLIKPEKLSAVVNQLINGSFQALGQQKNLAARGGSPLAVIAAIVGRHDVRIVVQGIGNAVGVGEAVDTIVKPDAQASIIPAGMHKANGISAFKEDDPVIKLLYGSGTLVTDSDLVAGEVISFDGARNMFEDQQFTVAAINDGTTVRINTRQAAGTDEKNYHLLISALETSLRLFILYGQSSGQLAELASRYADRCLLLMRDPQKLEAVKKYSFSNFLNEEFRLESIVHNIPV